MSALFKLNLDHEAVFWGAAEIHVDDVREGDVVLDHLPDNAPGRYRWDGVQKRLEPLEPTQVKTAPGAPSLDQAFHHLVESLKEAGHALPPAVHAWAEEFKKTLDAH